MSELRSAPLPPVTLADRVRGPRDAPTVIAYVDLECPFCAAVELQLGELVAAARVRSVFRHFPIRSAHPRAWPAAAALEAAARQQRFWEMHDLLLADQGRLEDPHLWQRASALGLDVDRFDADRRDEAVLEQVRADFKGGVRAGVVTTPTVFSDGVAHSGDSLRELLAGLAAA